MNKEFNTLISNLKDEIENKNIICTGDSLVSLATGHSLLIFTRNAEDGLIWAATPNGVLLYPCPDFFEYCEKKAKEYYYTFVKSQLRDLKLGVPGKTPKKGSGLVGLKNTET